MHPTVNQHKRERNGRTDTHTDRTLYFSSEISGSIFYYFHKVLVKSEPSLGVIVVTIRFVSIFK